MILSGHLIGEEEIISPFLPRTRTPSGLSYGSGPAGYDIRIAQSIGVPPSGFALASSIEHFKMPDDVVGFVADKSSHARTGLSVFNTVIEPGWTGYLTIELFKHRSVFSFLQGGGSNRASDIPSSGR